MRKTLSALAKREISQTRWRYRRATCRYRCLPDVIIIGAQKSGTTSLYSYLSQHYQLMPSVTKEVHFFDGGLNPEVDNFSKGPCWYRAFFPFRRIMKDTYKAFEASPLYLFNPLAPRRIAQLLPDVKLIAVLRNPTERAISHYFHSKRLGHEALSIMEALEAEDARLRHALVTKNYKDRAFMRMSYKSRGLYYEQLKRYMEYFKLENILILSSESLFLATDDVLRRVYRFIGIDTESPAGDLKPRNIGSNRSIVAPNVYSYLHNFFLAHNHKLYELIGQRFDWDAES